MEEVSPGKQVTGREEVIRDTVRNTEVDMEQIPGAGTTQTTWTDTNQNSQGISNTFRLGKAARNLPPFFGISQLILTG